MIELPAHQSSNGIAYRRLGAGRPLLLVHGGAGSWLHWTRNIEPLARTHDVIAVDLPGYGESDDVPPDITLDAYVERVLVAVHEAIREASLIDIVAFSFGGLIATEVAVRLGAAARRLVLFAPSGFERPIGRELGRKGRSKFPPGDEGEREFLRHNLVALMLAEPASADDEAIAIQRRNLARSRFNNTTDEFSYSNRLPALLAQLRCPVLLAYGEQDRTPYPSRDARLEVCRKARPDLAFATIPGAGHWVPFERASATNDLIERFLNEE